MPVFSRSEREEREAFAVGHLALGYLLSKCSSKLLKTRINMPLVLLLSVIPDADVLLPFVEHRGPFHSAIVIFAVSVPAFVLYRKRAVPYFLAVFQHSLLGDYVAGMPLRLLWPTVMQYYGVGLNIDSSTNIAIEWTVFAVFLVVMLASKDTAVFLSPNRMNLFLSAPLFTVLSPVIQGYPLSVPVLLIVPHLFYIALLSWSVGNALWLTVSQVRNFL